MKYIFLIISSIILSFTTVTNVVAKDADNTKIVEVNQQEKEKIITSLNKAIPEIKVDAVLTSPINNLYQVAAGAEIFYMTTDGKYFFHGGLLDLSKDKNSWDVSSKYKKTLISKNMLNLKKEDMIVFKPKTKSIGSVVVFTDIDCGFCKKFHDQMDQMLAAGIEVQYASFPRGGKGSPGYSKAVSVWCSADRNRALTDAKSDKEVPIKSCDNPVDLLFNIGLSMGIRATPTLIYEDGTFSPGYLPVDRLITEVKDHSKTKKG